MEYDVENTMYGATIYYKKGTHIIHRENGPAIIYSNGDIEWHMNGEKHREDGPAMEWKNGLKEWYIKGKRHRIDGPAITHPDGRKLWFVNGKYLSTEKQQLLNKLWNSNDNT
jgi:hypothetical protein